MDPRKYEFETMKKVKNGENVVVSLVVLEAANGTHQTRAERVY